MGKHPPPGDPFRRFILLILDSVGCGEAPDAEAFGDAGANTLARIIAEAAPSLPNLARLGLDRVPGVPALAVEATTEPPLASWGRMTESSAAKDTMSGHWELMGVVSERAFPVYPDGFPEDVMRPFEEAIGRGSLGNVPASGTAIIDELGAEHMRTGSPIVYTSGDSVFQIAAHEAVIGVEELYAMCETARRLLQGEHQVARVIARPFEGDADSGFQRTPRRRDLALPPPEPTALDILTNAGYRTFGIGKIHDIFSGRGLTDWAKTRDNADGVEKTIAAAGGDDAELIFTNLVDFDTEYGHRRDVKGYARALEAFDRRMPELLAALRTTDCLLITADHGNDPGYSGSDHTRERVPLLAYGGGVANPLGTRASFADLGATVLENFRLRGGAGTSFLHLLRA